MKDYREEDVKNMYLDIAKVISNYSGLDTDTIGSFYIRTGGKWDITINVIYIMQKKKVNFEQAVYLYKEFVKRQLADRRA